MKQYVVINEQSSGLIFCIGIFDDYRTAIGEVMMQIWEFKDSYQKEDDTFKVTEPYDLEGENGVGFAVTYKAGSWKAAFKDYYFIIEGVKEDKK